MEAFKTLGGSKVASVDKVIKTETLGNTYKLAETSFEYPHARNRVCKKILPYVEIVRCIIVVCMFDRIATNTIDLTGLC